MTRRILQSDAEADDAAQEALLRAWRMRAHCRDPTRYLAWLGQIARHEALRIHAQRRPVVELDDSAHGVSEDESAALADRLVLARLLQELRPDERALLHLRYEEDLTLAQVASRLGTPVGTAKVRLHRLQARLRTRLLETECR